MKFFNIIDEKGRFIGLDVAQNEPSGQVDSNTYSYLHLREMYKEIGDIMGLEQDLEKSN